MSERLPDILDAVESRRDLREEWLQERRERSELYRIKMREYKRAKREAHRSGAEVVPWLEPNRDLTGDAVFEGHRFEDADVPRDYRKMPPRPVTWRSA